MLTTCTRCRRVTKHRWTYRHLFYQSNLLMPVIERQLIQCSVCREVSHYKYRRYQLPIFKQKLDAENFIEYYKEHKQHYYDDIVSSEVELLGEYGHIMTREDFEGMGIDE